MKTRNILIALAIMATATTGFAQLSMAKADWARGPVQFLMTPEEKTQWNAVKSDAGADQFIALFWARRDPTPRTPQNEFREEFERRVQFTDQNFGGPRVRGSISDRGKILILFGAPTRAVRSGGGPSQLARPTAPGAGIVGGETDTEAEDTTNAERQLWTYEGANAEKMFGSPHVEFRFIDRMNNRDLRLEAPRIDLSAAQQKVAAAAITQPNLTEPPTFQRQQPPAAQQPVPAATPAPVTTLKTAALESAVADAKAGKIGNKGAMISYAEFVAPTGEYYVPAGLYIPASAGLSADAADTFFGVVEDATGKRVLAFEEPAKLIASKGNFLADKTLDLSTGKYNVVFGLAKAGTPLLVASAALELTSPTKDAAGTSGLVLSNDIQTTPEAAPVKTPFAFGQLLIIPKADLQFTNKDELNYFVELHNPGIDPTTKAPKLQMKMELVDAKGTTVAGRPLSDVETAPLSGQLGPGEYAIVNGIPLALLSKPLVPGQYTLKMKIIDTVSKQSYNVEQKFKITV